MQAWKLRLNWRLVGYCVAGVVLILGIRSVIITGRDAYKQWLIRDRDAYKRRLTLEMRAAITRSDTAEIRFLLQKGVSPTVRGDYGKTALDVSAGSNDVSLTTYLLSCGIPIDQTDDCGYTPLIYAASDGAQDTVRLLIRRGANVNLRGSDGRTALLISRGMYSENTWVWGNIIAALKAAGEKE